MFRGLLRCSLLCRHAATAAVVGTTPPAPVTREVESAHVASADATVDRFGSPHLAGYAAAALSRKALSAVFAPMRQPVSSAKRVPHAGSQTSATPHTTDGVAVPRRRVVMTKAQQIRQAAARMREAQRAQMVNSPAAFLILSAQQVQLDNEKKLIGATLQRLQAEKELVRARQECAEDMQQFALGIQQRQRALLAGQDEPLVHDDVQHHVAAAAAAVPMEPCGDVTSTKIDAVATKAQHTPTVAIDAARLDMPATADADAAAGAMRGRTRRGRPRSTPTPQPKPRGRPRSNRTTKSTTRATPARSRPAARTRAPAATTRRRAPRTTTQTARKSTKSNTRSTSSRARSTPRTRKPTRRTR